MTTTMGRRTGATAAEFVIALLVLGLALLPLVTVFTSTRTAVATSKLAYQALVAAQEHLEEIRQLPFETLAEQFQTPTFRPVSGNAFALTLSTRNEASNRPYGGLDAPEHGYPADYHRVFLRTSVEMLPRFDYGTGSTPGPDPLGTDLDGLRPPRLARVTVEYYWQERGEQPDEALRRTYAVLTTLVGDHHAR